MDFDEFYPTAEVMGEALDDAVALGWLAPVDRGFCFYCNQEKAVYDVTMPDAPVQPPRCAACFLGIAQQFTEDPERWAEFKRQVDDGTA
jgi:hypothetical protein